MKKIVSTMLAAAALACSLSANAVPVTFDISAAKSSVKVTDLDTSGCVLCDIDVGLVAGLGNQVKQLSAGQTWSFDFFSINFSGLFGKMEGSIAATLGFDAPAGAPSAGGDADGWAFTILGVITGGELKWTSPVSSFTLANGTAYDVWFDNLAGIALGSTKVGANIKLRAEPGGVNVPEPATLGLLGLGLLGIGMRGRRKAA